MEQLFTNRKFHFCSLRNFWVFFLNGKVTFLRYNCVKNGQLYHAWEVRKFYVQARNLTTNVPKILDLKSSSEQIFSKNGRWVPLTIILMWQGMMLTRLLFNKKTKMRRKRRCMTNWTLLQNFFASTERRERIKENSTGLRSWIHYCT